MEYLDLLLDAVCFVSSDGRVVSVSAASERIFGYRPEEMVGRVMLDMVVPEDRERTRESVRQVLTKGSLTHFENRYIRKDGQIVDIMWTARWSDADQMRVGVARDITALKAARLRQAAAHDIFEAANRTDTLDQLATSIRRTISKLRPTMQFTLALKDRDTGRLRDPSYVSDSGGQPLTATPSIEALCHHVVDTGHPATIKGYLDSAWGFGQVPAHRPDEPSSLGVPLDGKQGTFGALVLTSDAQPCGDGDRDLLQFLAMPIASAIERMTMFNRLSSLARYDSLTGLPNRRLLEERLAQIMTAIDPGSTQLAMLYIDLDGFKAINDTHGHAMGDTLLKLAGNRLGQQLTAPDMVARLGGDEFVVLLQSGADPAAVAQRIRAATAAVFCIGDTQLMLSASIGIARYPNDGDSADELLVKADLQMYADKRQRHAAAAF